MEVIFFDFNNWMLSSSYTESSVSWVKTFPTSGEGESLIVNDHLNTIDQIQTPSGSGYGNTHFELIDITNMVITEYSSSL
tara:strand:+ start:363 stop:602 length:240 start_codon:yes stop_codon:yes gene_type:complete